MSESSAVFLQMLIEDGLGEARVNDLPVAREAAEGVTNSSIPIHEFLIDGENTLTLHAVPNNPLDIGRFKAHARIARFKHGEMMSFDGGEEIAVLQWLPNETSAPVGTRFAFETPHRWLWQDAPKLVLDEPTITRLDAYVMAVRDEFEARDTAALVERQAVYYAEMALAYPPPTVTDDGSLFAEDLKNAPDPWLVKSFAAELPRYRLVAEDRLVNCVGADGLPLVANIVPDGMSQPEQLNFPFPMLVGLHGKDFAIMR